MNVVRKFRLCPNCGHAVFGTRCKWCNQILTADKTGVNVSSEQMLSQEVEEMLTETGPETAEHYIVTKVLNDAQETPEKTDSAGPGTGKLLEGVETGAESESAGIISDAKREADFILAAEQAAAELVVKARHKAESESARIIANARQKAEEIRRKAEHDAAELVAQANLQAEATSKGIIAEAREKADKFVNDNLQATSKFTPVETVKNDKITVRDIILLTAITVIAAILVLAAYFYARTHL